jgi:hypothetical protein
MQTIRPAVQTGNRQYAQCHAARLPVTSRRDHPKPREACNARWPVPVTSVWPGAEIALTAAADRATPTGVDVWTNFPGPDGRMLRRPAFYHHRL